MAPLLTQVILRPAIMEVPIIRPQPAPDKRAEMRRKPMRTIQPVEIQALMRRTMVGKAREIFRNPTPTAALPRTRAQITAGRVVLTIIKDLAATREMAIILAPTIIQETTQVVVLEAVQGQLSAIIQVVEIMETQTQALLPLACLDVIQAASLAVIRNVPLDAFWAMALPIITQAAVALAWKAVTPAASLAAIRNAPLDAF